MSAAPPDAGAGGAAGQTMAAAVKGVFTQRYNNFRSGANLEETILTPANVKTDSFGQLFCNPVDDEIYSQILYVSNVDVAGKGKHNIVIVTTVKNTVYAFDADTKGAALWTSPLLPSGEEPPTSDRPQQFEHTCGTYSDFSKNMGIVGTPVVDPTTMTMYVVARSKKGTSYTQRFHALSLLDGKDRPGSPVVIKGKVKGTGIGAIKGEIEFDPLIHNQRAALLLHKGVVYFAYAGHCDDGPYHGWIFGYDAKTLAQVMAFMPTADGMAGGIWQSGTGMSTDEDGNIYFSTGNGFGSDEQKLKIYGYFNGTGRYAMFDDQSKKTADGVDPNGSIGNRAMSVMKMQPEGSTLKMIDWFSPFDWKAQDSKDLDLTSGGVSIIPGTKYLTAAGKDGKMYLLDRTNLGKISNNNSGIADSFYVSDDRPAGHVHGTPAIWKTADATYVYVMAEEDALKRYTLENGKLTKRVASSFKAPNAGPGGEPGGFTMPGGFISISANGTKDGIVWLTTTKDKDANNTVVDGTMYAVDASDVTKTLWTSRQNATRDDFGKFSKFNPPTVYAGHVYVATFGQKYCTYGKL